MSSFFFFLYLLLFFFFFFLFSFFFFFLFFFLFCFFFFFFFFSSRRRHTRLTCDWSSDVCSSDLFAWTATRRFCCGAPAFPRTTGPPFSRWSIPALIFPELRSTATRA